MKLYLWSGQMEGWEDGQAKWERGRVHFVSLWGKGNSISRIIEQFFTSFHISLLYNSSSCPFLPHLFSLKMVQHHLVSATPFFFFAKEIPFLFSELYSCFSSLYFIRPFSLRDYLILLLYCMI